VWESGEGGCMGRLALAGANPRPPVKTPGLRAMSATGSGAPLSEVDRALRWLTGGR